MRRGTGLLVLVSATAVAAAGVTHLPDALAETELFRVSQVWVEGNRYLTEAEVLETAALPPDASIWSDLEPPASRLRAHALVEEVRIRRRPPGTLRVEIVEREPVALLPAPTLTPVDREGRTLPLAPERHPLDLPLVQPAAEDGSRPLTSAEVRLLARELERLGELDPLVLASVSEAALGAWGDVHLRLGDPRVTLRYHPPLGAARLREGIVVLADALERDPERRPEAVDLRFADQVVVAFTFSRQGR